MEIRWWPTNNFGYPMGRHGRNGEKIVAVVNHIMEGTIGGYHSYLANPDRNSANYSVYLDGHIEHHVHDEDAAWCNGWDRNTKTFADYKPDMSVDWIARCWNSRISPNLVTLSIECEGYSGRPFPPAQVEAIVWLNRMLVERHGIARDRNHIVGHYRIDSVSKSRCPGTGFPWAQVMEGVQGMTAEERAKLNECAGHVWEANQRLSAILAEVSAATGPLPVVEGVLARIRAEQGEIHTWGVHWVKEVAGLNG